LSHATKGNVPTVEGAFADTTSLPFASVVPAVKQMDTFWFTVQPSISVLAGKPVRVAVYCSPALTECEFSVMNGF
jgi:hypothetical protein